ncbi:Leucine rich repeat variant [hydrothermal vent metagenome]|uniref:Leucine rich repeat variant n=1 Tax=hydrothermal vent metagenome TaxID=652676 RepID=A0A1W1EEV0_9ZZZZ
MKAKLTLKQLLDSPNDIKILFLGREGTFTKTEIERFFKKSNITLVSDYENDLAAIIEHNMLNPVEEDISNMAYENSVPLYKLKDFEKIMSSSLNDDELLMGIKLANDQSRILRLLGNEHINNTLFVKLLRMYEWDDEDDDSRDDRDVIMYTLSRYIDIKPNEEDLLYSYLTLRRLATEANDPKLLLALTNFPNFEFSIRGKEKITLRETIARNVNIDVEVINKLISFRDMKIDLSLSSNPIVEVAMLEKFIEKNSIDMFKALATNQNINNYIFEELLNKDEKVVELLLIWQNINMERLELIESAELDKNLFALLAANEYLEEEVVLKLLSLNSEEIMTNLAANTNIKSSVYEKIYKQNIEKTYEKLAKNDKTPLWILEELYKNNSDNKQIVTALSYNSTLSVDILKEMFERDDFEINKGLATNSSLPMELLDILKVDTRLQNYLAQNRVFIKEYETVLDYDKNAVQF